MNMQTLKILKLIQQTQGLISTLQPWCEYNVFLLKQVYIEEKLNS